MMVIFTPIFGIAMGSSLRLTFSYQIYMTHVGNRAFHNFTQLKIYVAYDILFFFKSENNYTLIVSLKL